MTTPHAPVFENTFVRDLPDMFEPWDADAVAQPKLLALNESLASGLGFDVEWLRSDDGVRFLVGNHILTGMRPVAQAYAGHQFGGYSPRMGDGRALLLGEVVDVDGLRHDLHLKGSGRTNFSRGGDGRAAIGPMLREYIMGEAMHALGVPTTRALAVVATDTTVVRTERLPGAVLCRVASSHLRVGSFQYAVHLSTEHVRRLADYAIDRHYPDLRGSGNPYLALLDAVIDAQASLVARWMNIGFIHGVMNTDNVTISGQTIDYGPCAFMDAYDPRTVFSSIDHQGRYAYGNQPNITQWNLARFAETLLRLIDDDSDTAVAAAMEPLRDFPARFNREWEAGLATKLGLVAVGDGDRELFDDLLELLTAQNVDFTNFMRSLSDVVRGDRSRTHGLFSLPLAVDPWLSRWLRRVEADGRPSVAVAAAMDTVNPAYIPRNHLVEAALAAATTGDLGPLDELMAVVGDPFVEHEGLGRYTEPMPPDWEGYMTFCGT